MAKARGPNVAPSLEESTGGVALLAAVTAAAALAVTGVEALSTLGLLLPWPLRGLGAAALAASVWAWRASRAPRTSGPGLAGFDRGVIGALAVIAGLTLAVALLAPPNTWDSMTYHSARVAHWLNQGTLDFYPTAIDRQLWEPAAGEYLVLVGTGALDGRDYLANLPQWLAGVGSAVAAMEIARLLGAERRMQLAAAVLVATAPAVVLQSSSTQTDLLATLWLSITAYLALAELRRPSPRAGRALWFGAALGLALGTKGTALPLGVPWAVVFVGAAGGTLGAGPGLRRAALVAGAVLALNAGHWSRTYSAYGTPLGPASVQRLLRPASLGPATLGSNLLANLSLHLGTPSAAANSALTSALVSLNSALGLDTGRLYPFFGGFRVVPWSTHEDLAGNPIHLLLGLAGLALALRRWTGLAPPQRALVVTLGVAGLLFCATVRWQPFNGRLHVPLVVLAAPGIALLLQRAGPRLSGTVLGILLAGALPPLLANQTRPLLPGTRPSILTRSRDSQYFAARPELEAPYRDLTTRIAALGCRRVGLVAGYDSWEYPLWSLGAPAGITYLAMAPGDPAASAPPTPPAACAVAGLDQPPQWPGPARSDLIWRQGGFSLWTPAAH